MDDFFDIDIPAPSKNVFQGVDLDIELFQEDDQYEFENEPAKSHPPPFYKFRKQPTIDTPKWVYDKKEQKYTCGKLVVYCKDIPPNTNKRPRYIEMYLRRFSK